MGRHITTGLNVFDQAVARLSDLYSQGHRLVVSMSGGKDSTIVLEVAVEAARQTSRLPVEAAILDEEIAFPGTHEYMERVHARSDVVLDWRVMQAPLPNVFDREMPYWVTFDRRLDAERWVRRYPDYATITDDDHLSRLITPDRYPAADGRETFIVTGIRVQESTVRRYAVHSAGGHITKRGANGLPRRVMPIYDWLDGDVWRAISQKGWDYNRAYDTMYRLGLPLHEMRISSPALNKQAARQLWVGRQAWPEWFERVCDRLPGIRAAVLFGERAVTPQRRGDETWEQAYWRTCVKEAPEWISERSVVLADRVAEQHARHSTGPVSEVAYCPTCPGSVSSWKKMAETMFTGDPGCMLVGRLLPVLTIDQFR